MRRAVNSVQELDRLNLSSLEPKGGGETDFRPVFVVEDKPLTGLA